MARMVNGVPVHNVEKRDLVCGIISGASNGGSGGSGGDGGTTIIKQVITTETVSFPVLINTFVPQNTVLNYYGGKFEELD